MAWINRILIALLAAGLIAWLPRHISGGDESTDLVRVVRERDDLRESNDRLHREIDLLDAEVRALHVAPGDPAGQARAEAEIQRIARDDLNLVRPGEFVFEIDDAGEVSR